jgi:hypothetical protein
VSVKLTKRGRRAVAVAVLLWLALIYYTATHIHYTGEGYCWGSFTQCYGQEGGGK